MRPEALEPFALFRGLSPGERELVANVAQPRAADRGEVLFEAGSTAQALFGVVEGHLKVSALTDDGAEITMGLFTRGDIFGEPALLVHGPRIARVVALSECTLLTITAADFDHLIATCPSLSRGLLAVMAERTRHLVHHHIAIVSLSVAQRLARKLLILARETGIATPRGTRIAPPLSQRDLADMIATTRQSVNQHLRRWTSEGLIDSTSHGIVLVRREELQRIARADNHGTSGELDG